MDLEATPAGRRDLMIRLLRLGGLATAAAGLGVWLTGRGLHLAAPAAAAVRTNFQVPAEAALPDVVGVGPAAGGHATAEKAANTNPQVVAEVSLLCLEAAPRRAIVTYASLNGS